MSEIEFIDIFADNLRDLIYESGYSVREIAKETNISVDSIYRYLKKQRSPTLKAVVNLSLMLLCDVDDLIPFYDIVR